MNNKPYMMLTESQVKRIINFIVLEQSDLDEKRTKGNYKPEWDKEDHILAMYNSRYGLEGLGFSIEDIANNIIGTSKDSLIQSSLNFDSMDGKGGLKNYYKTDRRPDDYLPVQIQVYNEFKDMPPEEFKSICLGIINEKGKNSNNNNFNVGKKIGIKRDEVKNERDRELRRAGVNPEKATMIGQRPKYEPTPDDDEPIDIQPQTHQKNTPKDEIRDFLNNLYKKAMESNPELGEDIQFISDYIDSELVDKEMLSEIHKIFKPMVTEQSNGKIFKVTKTDIKNIIKKINT